MLIAALAAIADEDSGPLATGLSLAAGAAGAAAAMAIGARWPEPEAEPEAEPEPAEEAPYRPRFAERGEPAEAEAEQAPAR